MKVLIVMAHPDDEVIGCGATMARLASEGHDVYTAILGEGITSRDKTRDADKRRDAIAALKSDLGKANGILGVKETFQFDLPDNRFDSVDLLDVVKIVEEIKARIQPEMIFTHNPTDLNIDHTVTHRAVLTATRPMEGEPVKTIFACEVLSSSEWMYPSGFRADTFFDVSSTIDLKVKAMESYQSERRDYPHPRSGQALKENARMWGIKCGVSFAEAFSLVRQIL